MPTFEYSEWDFGTIREVDGVVCHEFEGTNKTEQPIVILRITSSCGCTTADYPTKPIAPNDSFKIKVCFDPDGRPDEFAKKITITMSERKQLQLTVKGVVVARPRTVEDDYPYYMVEGLRLSNNTFGFGTIQHGGVQSTVVEYVNTSNRAIHPKVVFEQKSGLLNIQMPRSIAAGQKGQINIMYDLTNESATYGRLIDKIAFEVNGKRSHHTIYTAAIAVDNFDLMDHDTAPAMNLSCRTHDFGEIIYGEQQAYKHRVTLTNEGSQTLIIRWVENKPQHFFITLPPETRIEGGKSTTFDMVLMPDGYDSETIFDVVSLITNDPTKPYVQLKARAKLTTK